MNISLSEKLKSLRKEKNVSQEKLAEYLGVSFQAVSKWENGNTYPDILLLSDIARFYGITIDELLQVEKIDEIRLFDEYEDKAENLYSIFTMPLFSSTLISSMVPRHVSSTYSSKHILYSMTVGVTVGK